MAVTRLSFASSLLTALNCPVNATNLRIVVAWTIAENGAPQFASPGAAPTGTSNYNPLGCKLQLVGSTDSGGGLQSYVSWKQGLDAAAQMISQPNMSAILSMLQTGSASPQTAAQTITSSPWGTSATVLTPALIQAQSVTPDGGQPITGNLFAPGTSNKVSASLWIVGSEQNPDEDYWSCINRYAMSAQLYAFSDGEALYVADGIQLMGQTPADVITLMDPRVIEAHLTYDNCLALDTPLPTPAGWTTMADVQAGDLVLGSDGRPTRVLGVSEVHRDHDCYRVEFSDGTSIVADDGHLWETTTFSRVGECERAGRHYKGVHTTSEIRDTLLTAGGRKMPVGKPNHRVRLAEPLDLAERALPLDPYVLGYWLGDGTTGTPIISVSDADVESLIHEIERAGYEHNARQAISSGWGGVYWRVSPRAPGGFSALLRRAGVLYEKHVPADYLRASRAQRLALLQGLMDSDGSVSRECAFCVADEPLARQLLELARSLGFAPTWCEKPARGQSAKQFVVRFPTKPHANAFRLPRKAQRYAARLGEKAHDGRRYRTIRAVVRVPSVPVKCIAVDAADHLYLVGDGMIPTHNTSFQGTHDAVVSRDGQTVRRAALARTTSPTECELKIICDIDAYRGGDVVILQGFGQAADGLWLLGECRRSVFDPFSTLTLVQGMAPLSAQTGTSLGVGYVAGAAAVAKGAGTVINAMLSEAASINNQHLPYEYGGGHAHAGTPDAGIVGGNHVGGFGVPGFDCSGAVAAVLAAGGLWQSGGSVPASTGIVDALLAKQYVLPGAGHGVPECTLYDSPVHIFMRLNGEFFGTEDGAGHIPTGSSGGGWIPNGSAGTGWRVTHIPPTILGQRPSALAGIP